MALTVSRRSVLAGTAALPFLGIPGARAETQGTLTFGLSSYPPNVLPWANTGTSTGRLMIAVLGGLADVERDLIRTRTAEGRSRAQRRRQHMGRPSQLTEAQKAEARRRRAEGATLAELARSYDVSESTISRLAA